MNKIANVAADVDIAGPDPRRVSVPVIVGGVMVGGGAPIVVQSMTNTDTADVEGTVRAGRGAGACRFRDSCASPSTATRRRPPSRTSATARGELGINVPLVGDFHYIGHKLLAEHPGCAEALAKYRINPGNVGFREKRDSAVRRDRRDGDPARQAGAHRRQLGLARPGTADPPDGRERGAAKPLDARAVTREAMVQSALLSAARAEEIGLARDRIILSAKVSAVQDLIAVYRDLARRSDYALHLGLTEAGMGSKGIVASAAAIGVLLQEGIGDTIRISLTPEPGGDRTQRGQVGAGTAADHGLPHVRAAGRRLPRLRPHHLDGVPGAGRRDPGDHHDDAGMEDAIRASSSSTSR